MDFKAYLENPQLLHEGTAVSYTHLHCHNDSGVATAGSLTAVRMGATMVQGTVNEIGRAHV